MADVTSNAVTRKAVGLSGRIGDFYDIIVDKVIPRDLSKLIIQQTFINEFKLNSEIGKADFCPFHYFEILTGDEAISESLLVGLLQTEGISKVMNFTGKIADKMRLLHICYQDRLEEFQGDFKTLKNPNKPEKANHVITGVVYGFEILCIIRIREQIGDNAINKHFNEILENLKKNPTNFEPGVNEKRFFSHFEIVKLYGAQDFDESSYPSLEDVMNKMKMWRNNRCFHYPLSYILQTHQSKPNGTQSKAKQASLNFNETFFPAEVKNSLKIVFKTTKTSESSLKSWRNEAISNSLSGEVVCFLLKNYDQLEKIDQNLQELTGRCLSDGREYLIQCRQNRWLHSLAPTKDSATENQQRISESLTVWKNDSKKLLEKFKLIIELNQNGIEYLDLNELSPEINNSMNMTKLNEIVRAHLNGKNHDLTIWYCNSTVRKAEIAKWKQKNAISKPKGALSEEKSRFVYVDTSASSFAEKHLDQQYIPCREPSGTSEKNEENPPVLNQPIVSNKPAREINVLILGETGVGKSTFINAFVNYLVHGTLEQAEKADIISVIPASFTTTVGQNFKTKEIHIGGPDPNENFDAKGASVTQHCRSYLIPVRSDLHLRLIDTPGMGDTRGIEQDMKNIDHILSYIDQFTHLDAVCFLLKPNISRSDIFFRSCLKQLFTYLTPQAYKNIAFCFTNTRTTFYQVGDTGAVVNKILKDSEFKEIPFNNKNTFCFDSESFRYLAARKQNISFENVLREDFVRSWDKSSESSRQLLKFCEERARYSLDQWKSPRKLALHIHSIAYPLMVELRLKLYNKILYECKRDGTKITMHTKHVGQRLCSWCAHRKLRCVNNFDIVEHKCEKHPNRRDCRCLDDKNAILLESQINYHCVMKNPNEHFADVNNAYRNYLSDLNRLRIFLHENSPNYKWDPFRIVLKTFDENERDIQKWISQEQRKPCNTFINEELKKLKEMFLTYDSSAGKSPMEDIQEIINRLTSSEQFQQHYTSIRKTRQLKMEIDEIFVPVGYMQENISKDIDEADIDKMNVF